MDTLKTGVVVVLLLAVLYGFYVILNKEHQGPLPEEIAWSQQQAEAEPSVEMGTETTAPGLGGTTPSPSNSLDAPQPSWRSGWDAATPASSAADGALSISPATPGADSADAGSGATATGLTAAGAAGATSMAPPPLLSPTSAAAPTTVTDSAALPVAPPSTALPTTPPSVASPANTNGAAAAPAAPAVSTAANPATDTGTPAGDAAVSAWPTSDTPTAEPPLASDKPAAPADQMPSPDSRSGAVGHIEDAPPGSPPPGSPPPESAAPLAALGAVGAAGAIGTAGAAAPVAESEMVSAGSVNAFATLMSSTQAKIENGQWYDALLKLSFYYHAPEFTATERQQMLDWLDALAGKVIYSTEHLVEEAYQVQNGDTLTGIAERFQVPAELLANINGISDPATVAAGTSLKVLRGPFDAEISLDHHELTLFANKLYAGRFPITIGNEPAPREGEYRVFDKQPGRTYYAGGRTLAANDPNNPYGGYWLDLGSNHAIHGSASYPISPQTGCIRLSDADARDVFGILSTGSRVVIRR